MPTVTLSTLLCHHTCSHEYAPSQVCRFYIIHHTYILSHNQYNTIFVNVHTSRLVFVLGCLAPSLCQDITDSTADATYSYTYGETEATYDYGTYGTTADG